MKKVRVFNKSIYLIVALLLVLTTILSYILLNDSFALAESKELEDTVVEEKIYDKSNVEDEFDDSCVLVVIDKKNSAINKNHDDRFKLGTTIASIEDLTNISGNIVDKKYLNEENFHQILKLNLAEKSKQNVLDAIRKIEDIDGVLWAGVNGYSSFGEIEESKTSNSSNFNISSGIKESLSLLSASARASLPNAVNGSRFAKQWGLLGDYGISAPKAWMNYTMGSSSVKVGVIDTGIADHEDLDKNVVAGWDFYNDNEITNDDPIGHGTKVAGIIGASGESANGVIGVNWKVTLVPLQVVNERDRFQIDAAAKAITWAIENDIDILNYSSGGDSEYEVLKTAIGNYQGLFVCSAGNNARNVDWGVDRHYPS